MHLNSYSNCCVLSKRGFVGCGGVIRLHVLQTTTSIKHDLCLEALTSHSNELRLFWAMAFPPLWLLLTAVGTVLNLFTFDVAWNRDSNPSPKRQKYDKFSVPFPYLPSALVSQVEFYPGIAVLSILLCLLSLHHQH